MSGVGKQDKAQVHSLADKDVANCLRVHHLGQQLYCRQQHYINSVVDPNIMEQY